MNRTLGQEIVRLKSDGKSHNEISIILGCAKSSVTFHCNKSYHDRRIILQRKRRNTRKEWYVDVLGGKCLICGYERCKSALEPHHVLGGTKDISIKNTPMAKRSLRFIREEIKKCVLLCCRCHREVHAGLAVVPSQDTTF